MRIVYGIHLISSNEITIPPHSLLEDKKYRWHVRKVVLLGNAACLLLKMYGVAACSYISSRRLI